MSEQNYRDEDSGDNRHLYHSPINSRQTSMLLMNNTSNRNYLEVNNSHDGTNYLGMNNGSGRVITDMQHINQSIKDILTTPIGSRIARRDYGSLLFLLIDNPHNAATRLRVIAATVMALTKWEPRIAIDTVDLLADNEKLTVRISGSRTDKPNEKFNSDIVYNDLY